MVDEIFDRQYQAGRAALNNGLHEAITRAGRSLSLSLAALHRIQFDAPWAKNSRDAGCA